MFPPGGDSKHPAHHLTSGDYQAHGAHQPEAASVQEDSTHGRFRSARANPGRSYRHDLHSPPVRDAASIKGVKYGICHDKYPSWPTSAAAEVPQATRSAPTGGSHRSKSWTDHTQYPKESLVLYTRPYMKRHHHHQQLRPVFEATDRMMPGPFKGHREVEESEIFEEEKQYEVKEESFAEKEFGLPSPPERETPLHKNLDEYSTTYEVKMVMQQETKIHYLKNHSDKEPKKLTQAELEEYTKNCEESLNLQHQKQSSYAQSEGYHSYVSSADSISTPFLDRLRREADSSVSRSDSGLSGAAGGVVWDAVRGDRDSVVTTSSGSGSSSETLKWHGSLSDISVASSSLSHTSKQLIAHSAKVKTPQRHGSESVLYIARPVNSEIEHRSVPPGNCQKHLKLFPVSTYAVPDSSEQKQSSNNRATNSYSPPQMTVAERVNKLEQQNKFAAYQDSKRQSRIGDPNLKAKQKSALLSFYERQQQKENKQSWRSEPQLASIQPPPPLQARPQQPSSRRASSASEYADWRETLQNPSSPNPDSNPETPTTPEQPIGSLPLHMPNSARFSPNSVLDGPVIVGPVISLDDWVPERPPKNAKLLRNVFPDLYHQDARLPSPDLPLPSPPTVLEDELFNDEPFPPPPADITEWKCEQEIPEKIISNISNKIPQCAVMENVSRPLPVRAFSSPIKPQEHVNEICTPPGTMTEHGRTVTKPTDLSLNAIDSTHSHNPNKKPFSNFNEKTFRNSFRTPQDIPLPSGCVQDIRASMRYYRSNATLQNKALSPQKPTISAQRLLFRSTTVDETSSSPKRPINPFLRSTSLRQNGAGHKLLPPAPPPLQTYQSDGGQKVRQSCGPALNGNTGAIQSTKITKSEIPRETIGHYRPECDKSQSVVSKIEQLQQILKGPVDRMDLKKVDISGSVSATVVSPPCQHGAMKRSHSGPPPLFPKQSVPGVVSKPDGGPTNRGNDNVCYAPSRAKLPDPSVGSYKLIQPKDEPPPCPKPSALPDLLMPTAESRPTYPSYEYITRKTCEKLLSLPLEYSRRSSSDAQRTPTVIITNNTYDSRQQTPPIEKLKEIEEEIAKNNPKADNPETVKSESIKTSHETISSVPSTPKQEDVSLKTRESKQFEKKGEDEAPVLAQPVIIIEEEESGEEDEKETLELPEETRWSESVPALDDFAKARRLLLEALPEDDELRLLTSLTHDQRSPIEFIRDFFGQAPSSGADPKRLEEGAPDPTEGEAEANVTLPEDSPPPLEELKRSVVSCSERLVAALETASEATAAATKTNDRLGASLLQRLTDPLSAKFTSHHTEVLNISALMSSLSARLARTYDDADRCKPEGKQKEELRSKQEKLEEQLTEARSLKVNVDARSGTIAEKMQGVLDAAGFRDYRLFMAVKPRLIIRARHLKYRLDYERDRLKDLQQSFGER